MLSKLIVESYAKLIEISLWLLMLVAFFGGWEMNGLFGAVVSLVVAFILGTMFLGAFLVLEDIRKSVKAIEDRN